MCHKWLSETSAGMRKNVRRGNDKEEEEEEEEGKESKYTAAPTGERNLILSTFTSGLAKVISGFAPRAAIARRFGGAQRRADRGEGGTG